MEVRGGLRANRVQRHRLAGRERVRLDVDTLEAEVVAADRRGKILHVDGGNVQRGVKGVAREVAGFDDGADIEVDLADDEVRIAGLEFATGIDDDLGKVTVEGAVGVGGVEGGGAGVEQPAGADDDLRPVVVVGRR